MNLRRVPGSVHRRWRYWDVSAGRSLVNKVIFKEAGQSGRLHTCRCALLQFSGLFIHKTEQDMLTTHALAYMTNSWALFLHPGVDGCLEYRHAISAQGAIKAFVPIHCPILSVKKCNRSVCWVKHSTAIFVLIEGYCTILANNLP